MTGLIHGAIVNDVGFITNTLSIQVTDSGGGQSAPTDVRINVNAFAISPDTLGPFPAMDPIGTIKLTTGPTVTWSHDGGLPDNLQLAADGDLTGTPTTGGTYPVIIYADDGFSNTIAKSYEISVTTNLQITTEDADLPTALKGESYLAYLSVASGTGPFYWENPSGAQFGSLPPGLSLSSATGKSVGLSGVVDSNAQGSYTFVIRVTDYVDPDNPQQTQKTFTVNVTDIQITTFATLPSGRVNVAYSNTLSAIGGSGSGYTWAEDPFDRLPTGLDIDPSTGEITGTVLSAADYSFTVTVTDDVTGLGNQKEFTISFNEISIDNVNLDKGWVGVAYSNTLTANPAGGTYTWAVDTLPNGIKLDPGPGGTGVLSGSPDTAGSGSYTFTVTNTVSNQSVSKSLDITVGAALVIDSAALLPDATQNAAYSNAVTSSGGSGTVNHSWVRTSALATMPSGITVASSGVLAGTPVNAGTYTFTLQVTDSVSTQTASQSFTMTVLADTTPGVVAPTPTGATSRPAI